MTLGVAIASGVVTGVILKCKCFKGPIDPEDFYSDAFHFEGTEIERYKRVRTEAQSMSMVQLPPQEKTDLDIKEK